MQKRERTRTHTYLAAAAHGMLKDGQLGGAEDGVVVGLHNEVFQAGDAHERPHTHRERGPLPNHRVRLAARVPTSERRLEGGVAPRVRDVERAQLACGVPIRKGGGGGGGIGGGGGRGGVMVSGRPSS